jgi:Transposase DDE domain
MSDYMYKYGLDLTDGTLAVVGVRQEEIVRRPRSIHEGARDMAREIATTEAYRSSRCQRKKVEMLFAHLKRILKLDRLRLRGPNGARDEFRLAATAQNLRKLAMLILVPVPTAVT